MDYTRPDNINNQLSEGLIRADYDNKLTNNKNNIFIYLFILFLIIGISLLFWLYMNGIKLTNINIPIIKNPLNGGRPVANIPYVRPISTLSTNTVSTSTSAVLPSTEQIFFTIWPDAITGYSYIKNNITSHTSTSTLTNDDSVIFQDKLTGHIYKSDAPAYKPYKIANTTINNLFLSHFADNGKTIIFQTLNQKNNTLSTYIADIQDNYTTKSSLDVTPENLENKAFLGDNVTDFDVSPDGKNIAYIFIDKNYNSVINILNVNTRKIKVLLSYNLPDIHIDYFSSSTLAIYQYPDQNKITQAYNINVSNGNIYPIMRSQGLEIKTNSKGIIHSDTNGLFIDHPVSGGKSSITESISFNTRAKNCAWSGSGAFVLCGVYKSYNNKNLNSILNNTYIDNEYIYMYGVSYPEERMVYDFNNYNKELNKYEKLNVHIHLMSISDNSNLLTIMDSIKGFYLLKINTLLSAENN